MGTLRHFNLQQLIQDFNCKFLVETGTYKGDSVDYAMQFGFDKIYSIELYDKRGEEEKSANLHFDGGILNFVK